MDGDGAHTRGDHPRGTAGLAGPGEHGSGKHLSLGDFREEGEPDGFFDSADCPLGDLALGDGGEMEVVGRKTAAAGEVLGSDDHAAGIDAFAAAAQPGNQQAVKETRRDKGGNEGDPEQRGQISFHLSSFPANPSDAGHRRYGVNRRNEGETLG